MARYLCRNASRCADYVSVIFREPGCSRVGIVWFGSRFRKNRHGTKLVQDADVTKATG